MGSIYSSPVPLVIHNLLLLAPLTPKNFQPHKLDPDLPTYRSPRGSFIVEVYSEKEGSGQRGLCPLRTTEIYISVHHVKSYYVFKLNS